MIKVHWIKDGKEHEGMIPAEKLDEWFEWAKKYTWAYGWEEMGLTPQERMALTPAICIDNEGVEDYLEHGQRYLLDFPEKEDRAGVFVYTLEGFLIDTFFEDRFTVIPDDEA